MFGLARFCCSCEIPVGANLRGKESSQAAAEDMWGNVAYQSCQKVQRLMGGMLPRPRKNEAFRGCLPQGQETITKAEKTTREQFRL